MSERDKDKVNQEDQLSKMVTEGEQAITDKDKSLLIRVNEQIKELGGKALYSNPATWVYHFEKLI